MLRPVHDSGIVRVIDPSRRVRKGITMTTTTITAPTGRVGTASSVSLWLVLGALCGLGMTAGLAALDGQGIAAGTTSMTPATSVGVAALCYLAAAATRTRWVSWLGVPVFSGLAFAGLLVPMPWWVLFVIGGLLLLVVGVLAGAQRITVIQAAAMLGYFGVAVLALSLAPRLGLAVAGLALAAHALWDLHHYRRDIVVSRSLAIWCIGLDVTMGGLCLALAVLG